MKLTSNKKIALATLATTMMSTVVNANTVTSELVGKSAADVVVVVAEVLTILCLVVFALYMGRFFSIKTDKEAENNEKVLSGVKNGIMTALIGMAICQAAIIVSQLCF